MVLLEAETHVRSLECLGDGHRQDIGTGISYSGVSFRVGLAVMVKVKMLRIPEWLQWQKRCRSLSGTVAAVPRAASPRPKWKPM